MNVLFDTAYKDLDYRITRLEHEARARYCADKVPPASSQYLAVIQERDEARRECQKWRKLHADLTILLEKA